MKDGRDSSQKWASAWYPVEDEATGSALGDQLLREVGPGHLLYGIPVRTLGRRVDNDDVVYALADGTGRVAVVHLTWVRTVPERLPWPATRIYASLEDWFERGMLEE